MDPTQVRRAADGVMVCTQCGFRYDHTRTEIADLSESGLERVREALQATPIAVRGDRLAPDVWSVNAYLGHLNQAAAVIRDRVQRMATEDRPTLIWWDESESVIKDRLDERDADESLSALEPRVRTFVALLRSLPDDAWTRPGHHSTAGEVQLGEVAHDMAHELGHHADDVRAIGVERRIP
jgi:hypothetical protein